MPSEKKLGNRNITIEGLDEYVKMATKLSPRGASAVAKSAVQAVASKARNIMRKKTPKADGTLRKAIVSKRRRGTPTEAVSEVRITHGKGTKHDAWYWHFLEFGTVKQSPKPYIMPTVEEIRSQIPALFREEFGKKLEKRLEKEARKQGVLNK